MCETIYLSIHLSRLRRRAHLPRTRAVSAHMVYSPSIPKRVSMIGSCHRSKPLLRRRSASQRWHPSYPSFRWRSPSGSLPPQALSSRQRSSSQIRMAYSPSVCGRATHFLWLLYGIRLWHACAVSTAYAHHEINGHLVTAGRTLHTKQQQPSTG